MQEEQVVLENTSGAAADSYTASPLNGNPGGTAVTNYSYKLIQLLLEEEVQEVPAVVRKKASGTAATNGSNSIFSTITSTGGGRWWNFNLALLDLGTPGCGGNGGSGGGGSSRDSGTNVA